MMNKGNNQRIMRADNEFIDKLAEIKAKRTLAGYKNNSMCDITKAILKSNYFTELERELVDLDKAVLEKLKRFRL